MAEKTKHNYDESKIKTLSSLEHIRLRTGMYIGRIGNGNHYDDGCYILLKEVIDNAIDEYIVSFGKEAGQARLERPAGIPNRAKRLESGTLTVAFGWGKRFLRPSS